MDLERLYISIKAPGHLLFSSIGIPKDTYSFCCRASPGHGAEEVIGSSELVENVPCLVKMWDVENRVPNCSEDLAFSVFRIKHKNMS